MNTSTSNKQAKKIITRVAIVTIAINLLLTAFKIVAGFVGHSTAMVSDGIHSGSDVISTIIVLIGSRLALKPYDKDHPYGHERFECVASIILAVLLFITGAMLGYNGIKSLVTGSYKTFENPTALAIIAASVSIVVKEAMFWYTYIYAKKISSLSLKADAWHHRSDALSSVGSLLGIIFTIIWNNAIFDRIASIIICLFILKVAIDIFLEAVDKMIDKAVPNETYNKIKNNVLKVDGVVTVDELKTRMFGNKIYVDIEIGADRELPLYKAHKIAENVHHTIENADSRVKHCMVHVNPIDTKTLAEDIVIDEEKAIEQEIESVNKNKK